MRVVLTSLCFIAFALPAAAQTQAPGTPGVLDQVYACANISDEAQRLACYDGAVGRLREAQTTGNLVAVDRAQAAQVEREAFGFSMPNLARLFNRGDSDGSASNPSADPRFAPIDRVQLSITRATRNSVGAVRLYMNDGSSWEVTDGRNRLAREGSQVEIRRGAVGGYMMYFDNGPALRVDRRS